MNYYEQIKEQLINNEIYKKVKDYSKNRSDLKTYYNVGKMLVDAGKHYGEGIIKEYSKELMKDVGRGYNIRNLYNMRLFYLKFCNNEKLHTLCAKLSWSHIRTILSFEENKMCYYMNETSKNNLSVRELLFKIKNNEYERLDNKTKTKLIENKENKIEDFIKNPIILKTKINKEKITEKILHNLILENMKEFLNELGSGFSYISDEYKIKIGDRYNYIDLLLFNYIYNCFVVVELKVTEIKAEHIGQLKKYMNYVDKNIKKINQDNTIGIIIVQKDNDFIMEYCSDSRIFKITYELV